MEVHVIAVNYNGSKYTIEYYNSILAVFPNDKYSLIFIVVDNGSSKEEFDKINDFAKDKDKCYIVKNQVGKGYLNAINRGIKESKKIAKADFILAGNNDIIIEQDDFFQTLENYEQESDIMMIAPCVITLNGQHQNPFIVKKHTFFQKWLLNLQLSNYTIFRCGLFLNRLLSKMKKKEMLLKKKNIYAAHGSLFILTSLFVEKIYPVWDDIFLYGEEIILAEAIKKHQGMIIFDPNLKVTHKVGKSISKSFEIHKRYKMYKESMKRIRKHLDW